MRRLALGVAVAAALVIFSLWYTGLISLFVPAR